MAPCRGERWREGPPSSPLRTDLTGFPSSRTEVAHYYLKKPDNRFVEFLGQKELHISGDEEIMRNAGGGFVLELRNKPGHLCPPAGVLTTMEGTAKWNAPRTLEPFLCPVKKSHINTKCVYTHWC